MFTLPESLKFTSIRNTTSYLINFINLMSLRGLEEELFPKIYPLTLGEAVEISVTLYI